MLAGTCGCWQASSERPATCSAPLPRSPLCPLMELVPPARPQLEYSTLQWQATQASYIAENSRQFSGSEAVVLVPQHLSRQEATMQAGCGDESADCTGLVVCEHSTLWDAWQQHSELQHSGRLPRRVRPSPSTASAS
jgi:hypothetical protein